MDDLPFKAHRYYQRVGRRKHPEVKAEWILRALVARTHRQVQEDGRIHYWFFVAEAGKYLRVVLEPDDATVLNAFLDRDFIP